MDRQQFTVLADLYDRETKLHSFAHMYERTTAFNMLLAEGTSIISWIIEDMSERKRWGMNWAYLLHRLTGITPLQPEEVEGGFVKWDVSALCSAWIDWYNQKLFRRPVQNT